MDQIKVYLSIELTGFKMGWPIIKWAACCKTGQITNWAITHIPLKCTSFNLITLLKLEFLLTMPYPFGQKHMVSHNLVQW